MKRRLRRQRETPTARAPRKSEAERLFGQFSFVSDIARCVNVYSAVEWFTAYAISRLQSASPSRKQLQGCVRIDCESNDMLGLESAEVLRIIRSARRLRVILFTWQLLSCLGSAVFIFFFSFARLTVGTKGRVGFSVQRPLDNTDTIRRLHYVNHRSKAWRSVVNYLTQSRHARYIGNMSSNTT